MIRPNRTKILLYFIVIFIFLAFVFLLNSAAKQNHGSNMPSINGGDSKSNFDLKSNMARIPVDSFMIAFPYRAYAMSSNIRSITSIKQDLKALEELYPGRDMDIQQTFSLALTDSLKAAYDSFYDQFVPDSLIRLFQWSDQFSYYGEYDEQKQMLYQSISTYWLDFINNKLANYSDGNSNLKYDFKYKFLVAKCAEKKSYVPVKVTPLEKVIYNILGSHWSHLFNASWQQATVIQRLLLGFLLAMTLFSYFTLGLFFIKKSTKKNPTVNSI